MTYARRLQLSLARARGSVQRRAAHGWGPVVLWLLVVGLGLLVLPAVVNLAFDRVPDGTWATMEAGNPHLADVWSVPTVLAVAAVILALRWLVRARRRVVVEGFVDYTKDDAQAVKGLATLLIAELSRLHELYGRVNDELSTPMSVGVQGRGGTGLGTNPGQFLSVSADDVSAIFNDAIATETTVAFAGMKIPIGFVLSLVGRLARGPRIVGSLHYTEATGGPMLTAQLVGGRQAQQWRVDAPTLAAGVAIDKAFLDPMVTELACRMFNDLTLRGSVRWRAIRSFTEYLELYWESARTPRDRATKLESAEGKLLEAIAEDEGFDLAYYNLGVVYSQLADTERAAAERSDYVKASDRPDVAYAGRVEAALAAFNRAVAINRDRTEAVYALAVHEYTRVPDYDSSVLDEIVCRCDRVLELDPRHAQAHDLKGMALIGLGRVDESEAGHKAAVAEFWRRLLDTERAERKVPPTVDSLLPGARSNLAAALRNLADVNHVAAEQNDRRLERLARADRLYELACELATGDSKAATLRAYGRMLECRGDVERALPLYHSALKIDPENPVYWAHLAGAHAAAPADADKARRFAATALDGLAAVYRRTLEPHAGRATVALRESTLKALRQTYIRLNSPAEVDRIDGLTTLWCDLEDATRAPDVARLRKLKEDCTHQWEREQVQIALARALGREDRWIGAAVEYRTLIARLEVERPKGIIQHSLHAKHARALRRHGRREEALEAAAKGQLQDPLSASVRREVGKAHFALLQFDEALEAWKQTLWITPNDPCLHWKVAFCHWSVAQDRRDDEARCAALDEAVAGFERAATLFGVRSVEGWAWSQLWAGRVREELGEHDAAIRHFRSAAGCTPTKRLATLLLGEVYGGAGDRDASRVQLESAQHAETELTGAKLDADWGETISDREAAVRVRVALGRLAGNERAMRRHAAQAREIVLTIDGDPAAHARCLAAVGALDDRGSTNGHKNGVAVRDRVLVRA